MSHYFQIKTAFLQPLKKIIIHPGNKINQTLRGSKSGIFQRKSADTFNFKIIFLEQLRKRRGRKKSQMMLQVQGQPVFFG